MRDRKQHLPIDLVAPFVEGSAISPERAMVAKQQAALLLARVDVRTRAAVVYHYLDGMSQQEIAPLVGWSRKTLGKKLSAFSAHIERLKREEKN